jgi:thymidylate kinase
MMTAATRPVHIDLQPHAVANLPRAFRSCVLVGGDHVGKSSLLRHLQLHSEWRTIGYEPNDGPSDAPLTQLRQAFDQFLASAAVRSAELVLSGLQLPLMYLRAQLRSEITHGNVLMDSYYYKILAKCALKGLFDSAIFELWRGLPAPDAVIFLRADPQTLWQRSGAGALVNPFECYGERPSRQGFLRFQADLMAQIALELRGLRVYEVDADATFADVEQSVLARLDEIADRAIRTCHE